ncbi:MAG: hypothetical protein KDB40_21415 [Acidimicrobiales bacterium]|nr:hypothetical protein [Acidimicrobiales bacterium]MCB9393469.1 hypothetical protein [Acidimicrobiaceae bacterium]
MAAIVAAALVLVACGGDDAATDTTAAPDTTAAAAATSVGPVAGGFDTTFERVVPGGDCECADGSEFAFWVREADPERVLLFFQGGGACFSAETCAFGAPTYRPTTDAGDDPSGDGGVFDLDDERNPFRDHSIVFVPYCTGDVHLGDAEADYGDGLVVQHRGAVNGRAAVAELVDRFPDATEVVVAGESAGAIATPMYAGLVGDDLPDARLTVLADGSGAYPDVPAVNASIGARWGTEAAIPDWPVNDGLTAADWSFPDLFVQAGRHRPDIVFARHDYAYDRVQTLFAALAGLGVADLLTSIDANEASIEAAGVPLASYVSPGADHTVLSSRRFYDEATGGVPLVDWVTDLVAGDPVDDVRCEVCTGS